MAEILEFFDRPMEPRVGFELSVPIRIGALAELLQPVASDLPLQAGIRRAKAAYHPLTMSIRKNRLYSRRIFGRPLKKQKFGPAICSAGGLESASLGNFTSRK